jgi:hypothetical protein
MILLAAAQAAGTTPPMEVVSRWSFEKDAPGANAVASGPAARIEKAVIAEGHAGSALRFEDWSVQDYLHPDPNRATRVVVPQDATGGLGTSYPLRVSVWIHPTADPIYYGGIVERGNGYGAVFRLVLLRGLRVGASIGKVSVRSSAPIALNAWHEVALTADGKTLTLTVDGVQAAVAELPAGEQRAASPDAVVIGERFSGIIDEVSISR